MGTSLNRRWFNVASAPGTGDVAVGSAVAGHLGLGAAHDGLSFDGVTYLDGSAFEIRNGCTYTHGTTTLSRGTLEESSTGSAISLSSSTTVMLSVSAGTMTMLDVAMQSVIPGGRLTTESGVPVSTSDRTAQSTIYYTPFAHNTVPLWDGAQWKPVKFTETSLALSGLTSGKPYDVFGYISSGVLALELLAWTDDTTRATAVTLQDGRYCKSGDKTRLLLGSIYTTGTTTTEDSQTKRLVNNLFNQAPRSMRVSSSTSHSYNGGYRYWNNNSALQIAMVISAPTGTRLSAGCAGEASPAASRFGICAQKLNGSTSYDGIPAYLVGASGGVAGAVVHDIPTGYHYIAALQSSASAGAVTFNSVYLAAEVLA